MQQGPFNGPIDFIRGLHENTGMRCITAWTSLGALLLALVYAPLFHLHDDEGTSGILIHAHFPNAEDAAQESLPAVETSHSEERTRSIDLLTATASPDHVHAVLGFDHSVFEPASQASVGKVSLPAPMAHAPPESRPSNPRSPPAR